MSATIDKRQARLTAKGAATICDRSTSPRRSKAATPATWRVLTRSGAMIAFLDFEASSLSEDSYPVEVGWIFEDGRSESHVIRPKMDWTDWDPAAEAIHGLSREHLLAEGASPRGVASRLLDQLTGHSLYATAPSWDGKWLSVLLRAGGIPRHALRLRDSDEAHLEAARNLAASPEEAASILDRVRRAQCNVQPEHRALPDARRELGVWLEVRRLAELNRSRAANEEP